MGGRQMTIFDFLEADNPKKQFQKILSVGDKIGKVVLGECRIATVTKVEGLPDFQFYRTDRGCYSVEEGYQDIETLLAIAEENRKQYKIIIPKNLSERITVEYAPRRADGKVLWAQVGIMDNMLFWKHDVTYQFLEPYDSEKKLMKEYEKQKRHILETYSDYRILETEKPMRRLYWSQHGFYADAEYVRDNG